jgi:2-amino-4-hydroxy-6-hydroxymethyldihydropteridine diphosphokinase
VGANLPSEPFDSPREACEAALARLAELDVTVVRQSRWYTSAPVPPSDQPWFVNGVAVVATELGPADLLATLHRIENEFGRVRRVRNEARVIDLDLLAYGDLVLGEGEGLVLPHPRLRTRAFVLLPLAEVAPDWRHPVSGESVADLIGALPADQAAMPLE